MKDIVGSLQIRFFILTICGRASCSLVGAALLFMSAGCDRSSDHKEQSLGTPVVAASGEEARDPIPIDNGGGDAGEPVKGISVHSVVNRPGGLIVASAASRSIPSRFDYPRARRLLDLEGPEGELYRFVLVSEDSLRQVVRFYRKRFPLAPYQYGEGARAQSLFSLGSGANMVRARVASVGAELDGIGAKPGDRTIISLRARPLADAADETGRSRENASPGVDSAPSGPSKNEGKATEGAAGGSTVTEP